MKNTTKMQKDREIGFDIKMGTIWWYKVTSGANNHIFIG